MKKYKVLLTHQAVKDIQLLTPKLREKCIRIIQEILEQEPHRGKRLVGDLKGSRSLRLSYQDRVVYSIDEPRHIVYIERAKTHYGD